MRKRCMAAMMVVAMAVSSIAPTSLKRFELRLWDGLWQLWSFFFLIHSPSWKRSFPPKFGSTLFGRVSLTPAHRYDASMISASLSLKAPEVSPSSPHNLP
jgi:hypothetical protein